MTDTSPTQVLGISEPLAGLRDPALNIQFIQHITWSRSLYIHLLKCVYPLLQTHHVMSNTGVRQAVPR